MRLRILIDILIRLSGVALIIYKVGVIFVFLLLSVFGTDWHGGYAWGKRMEIALDPWTYILGFGLIVAPTKAFIGLFICLSFIFIPLGSVVFLGYIGQKLIGQGGQFLGLALGLYLGVKIVASDKFLGVTGRWLDGEEDGTKSH